MPPGALGERRVGSAEPAGTGVQDRRRRAGSRTATQPRQYLGLRGERHWLPAAAAPGAKFSRSHCRQRSAIHAFEHGGREQRNSLSSGRAPRGIICQREAAGSGNQLSAWHCPHRGNGSTAKCRISQMGWGGVVMVGWVGLGRGGTVRGGWVGLSRHLVGGASYPQTRCGSAAPSCQPRPASAPTVSPLAAFAQAVPVTTQRAQRDDARTPARHTLPWS